MPHNRLRRSLTIGAMSTALCLLSGQAFAQQLPFPIPGTTPTAIPGLPGGIPGLPGATPTIPGMPGLPGLPGTPSTPTIPGMPPLPSIPAPGGTIAIPSIPGLPNAFKLFSPTGSLLMPMMKEEAEKIYKKLIQALPADKKGVVQNIPLNSEPNKSEVNAFAGCGDDGKTFVVITEGMYQILDLMAQARATDETFGTGYYDEYIKELAKQQQGKAQILPLPPGMLDVTKSLDQRKLKRQKQIFDEAIAYTVGHELAHHYLGHLGSVCGGGPGPQFKVGDVVRAARKVLPAINQANEIASDVQGTENLLTAGQAESEHKWTEGGGLLVIDFFKKIRDLNPNSVLFTFTMTHPAPEVRKPIVETTAKLWRMRNQGATPGMPSLPGLPGLPGTSGGPLPMPGAAPAFKLPFPLPIPGFGS